MGSDQYFLPKTLLFPLELAFTSWRWLLVLYIFGWQILSIKIVILQSVLLMNLQCKLKQIRSLNMEPLKICFVMNSVIRTSQINNINWHASASSVVLSKRSCVLDRRGGTTYRSCLFHAVALHLEFNIGWRKSLSLSYIVGSNPTLV